MDFVAGAVQEACVNEREPLGHGLDTCVEVQRGPTLFIHHPDLDGVLREAQELLGGTQQVVGEFHFLRPVLLGLHDVDRAIAGVVHGVVLVNPRDPADGGHDGVHDPLEHLGSVFQQDRGVGHEVAHIAGKHQGAAMDGEGFAVGAGVFAVGVQPTGERLVSLGHFFFQLTGVELEPVAIAQSFIGRINSGHGVLKVNQRADGGVENNVLDSGLVGGSDGGFGVDQNVDVQPVVPQQNRRGVGLVPGVSGVDVRFAQLMLLVVDIADEGAVGNVVSGDIVVECVDQGNCLVEEVTRPCDDLIAADFVVATVAFFGSSVFGNGVGSIECVI